MAARPQHADVLEVGPLTNNSNVLVTGAAGVLGTELCHVLKESGSNVLATDINCEKGEGGRFVENGAIAPGGKLPVNTNGGGLSCVHPNMYGAFATIEAVRQLRGTCGARQIKNARTAVVNGNGGNSASSQSTSVLATADAL